MDTVRYLPYLTFFELGLVGAGGEELEMIVGVFGNPLGEFLHFTQDGFTMFSPVFGVEFGGHFHAKSVDVT